MFAQSGNLHNLEIALRILRILRLCSNIEIAQITHAHYSWHRRRLGNCSTKGWKLRASCLKLEINEIWMLWGENKGKWKRSAAARSRTQDTSGLSRQCSATEPWKPDNHQPSQSSHKWHNQHLTLSQAVEVHGWPACTTSHRNWVQPDQPLLDQQPPFKVAAWATYLHVQSHPDCRITFLLVLFNITKLSTFKHLVTMYSQCGKIPSWYSSAFKKKCCLLTC